jgi:hypothetical protein
MAGQGPAPADQRRRRNQPARGEWVDLPPLEAPVLPELPELGGDEDWKPMTRISWAAWRTDPVTQMYSPSDIQYALDAIRLYDAMTQSTANEVRLRMDALGLTPKGKKDLRWRVMETGLATPAAKPPKRPKKTADRRARLSVVK